MTEQKPTGIYFDVKKKPYDIRIDNKKKEPKLSKNTRYTDKQNYRRYKTLTEPKLLSRIMVDANDSATLDVEDKIKKLLGLAVQPKKDERLGDADVFTAENPYIAPPEPIPVKAPEPEPRVDVLDTGESPINEVSRMEAEELTGALSTPLRSTMYRNSSPQVRFLGRLEGKTDEEREVLIRDRNRYFSILDIEQKATERGFYNEENTKLRNEKLAEIRKVSAKRLLGKNLKEFKDSKDRISDAFTLPAIGETPVAARTRRGRPVGSTNKPKGRTLEL